MAKSSFFAYLANGSEPTEKSPSQEKVAQDQDTVIGDAMVETSHLFHRVASDIDDCIAKNNQQSIDMDALREAALALAYMQGVDFGLAMDDKVEQWYLLEMERSMATIRQSMQNAFQTRIYVPIAPWKVMNYDPYKCDGRPIFIHALSRRQPEQKWIDDAKKEIMEDKHLKAYLQRNAETEYPELFDVFPGLDRPPPKEEAEEAPKDPEDPIGEEDDTKTTKAKTDEPKDKSASDDSPSVTSIRNLYRQNKIDKNQYIGSLATLLATGLITKSQFTRLKAGA